MRVLDDSIQVRTFDDAAALKAHYRDVRARLRTPKPVRVLPSPAGQSPAPKRVIEPLPAPIFVAAKDADWLPVHDLPKITARDILKIVVSTFGLPLVLVASTRRRVDIAYARQCAMWLMRRFTGLSYPEIGRRIGGRDHTTVLHGVRRIERVVANCCVSTDQDTPDVWEATLFTIPDGMRR